MRSGMTARSFLLSLWLLLLPAFLCADVAVPPLSARVTDLTGTLSAGAREALETKLKAFEERKGSQVAVLILPTTEPETIEQYSIRVVDAWKLGREKEDDGVLLIVAKNDRDVRIEVGRGLEGAIPDAIANRIVEDTIVPRFRDGDFEGGIGTGVDRILGVIEGEKLPEPTRYKGDRHVSDKDSNAFVAIVFVLMALAQWLRRVLGPVLGGACVGGLAFALVLIVLKTLVMASIAGVIAFVLTLVGLSSLGSGRSGGFGGGGFGGGSFGGGGGGFGGGGGSFGGGGASGRW